MALGEAKVKARMEFDQVLQSTGKRLDDIKDYVADILSCATCSIRCRTVDGVTGTAANFVLHVSDLMDGKARLSAVPAPDSEAGAGRLSPV